MASVFLSVSFLRKQLFHIKTVCPYVFFVFRKYSTTPSFHKIVPQGVFYFRGI